MLLKLDGDKLFQYIDESDNENHNKWLYYDDTSIMKLDKPSFMSNKEVYILFYEMI